MRKLIVSVVLGIGICSLMLFTPATFGGSPPTVYSVIEGQDSSTGNPILVLVGNKLTKFREFALYDAEGADAGTLTLLAKSKTMLVLDLPDGIEAGSYEVECKGKKDTFEAHVQIGGLCFGMPVAGSIETNAVEVFNETGAGIVASSLDANAIYGVSSGGYGVYGASNGEQTGTLAGVHGSSTSRYGMYGHSNESVGIYATSNGDHAIHGRSHAAQPSAGVFGESNAGFGVSGHSTSEYGVYGYSPRAGKAGVLGESVDGAGVYGYSVNLNGVHGWSQSGDAVKGSCPAESTNGSAAIYGIHTGVGPAGFFNAKEGHGVWAKTSSMTAFAGYFEGVNGIYVNGNVYGDGGDFAERVSTDRPAAEFGPGDVIAIDEDAKCRFCLCGRAESSLVAGVYSTKPGVLGRSASLPGSGESAGEIPLAIVGIVPVKVCDEGGAIRTGDLLVSASVPGHAKRAPDRPKTGTVIGKALEPLSEERGKIEVLISLR